MVGRWPMVGREGELAAIVRALTATETRGVFLTGDAGVGKSRLLAEALAVVRAGGCATEHVLGTQVAGSIPFGVFASLMPAVDAATRYELVQATVDVLEERAQDGGLVLSIDDAHLLDDASATVLHILATRPSPVRLLVTVRSGEQAPHAVTALWKESVLERLAIAPLTRDHTAELLREVLGPAVKVAVVERLWELSRGNALFLHELVAAAADAMHVHGEQTVRLPLPGEPMTRLQELVADRLGLLADDERDALDLIALADELPVVAAEAVATATALQRLEARGLITVAISQGIEVVRVAHPLYGEVLRSRMPRLRRRALLRHLSAVVGEGPFDPLMAAVWRLEIDDVGDPTTLADAAGEALGRFDYVLAERLSRAAITAGGPGAPLLAEALVGQGRCDDAEEVFAATSADTAGERARVAAARAANLFWGLGRVSDALDALREGEQALAAEPEWAAECRSQRSQLLLYCAPPDRTLQVANSVIEDRRARPVAKVRALAAASAVWAAQGHAHLALAIEPAWFDLAGQYRREAAHAELQLRMTRWLALIWSGSLLDAEAYAESSFGLDVERRTVGLAAVVAGARGWTRLERGRPRQALALLTQSIEALREVDWFGLRAWAAGYRARAAVFAGDLETARLSLAEADVAFSADPIRAAFAVPDIELSRAWLMAAEGGRAAAIEHALGLAAATPVVPVAASILHAVARLGRPDAVVDRLAALAADVDGELAPLLARHAAALVSRDAAQLDAASHEFERLGADLLAAEAACTAVTEYGRASLVASALACEERARSLLARIDHPQSPALDLRTGSMLGLTRREHEMAVMAARGLSSREIAERTGVTVRTVDTHLHRVYQKLGIGGRAELAAVIRPVPA